MTPKQDTVYQSSHNEMTGVPNLCGMLTVWLGLGKG